MENEILHKRRREGPQRKKKKVFRLEVNYVRGLSIARLTSFFNKKLGFARAGVSELEDVDIQLAQTTGKRIFKRICNHAW